MEIDKYFPSVVTESQKLKNAVFEGSLRKSPNWNLDEDFDAYLAPVYLSVLSVNGTISLLMHFLVFWLIGYKTPKEMKDYKIFLFNIAVVSFFHDVQLTVYWRPVPFFPIPAAFLQGPSRIIGDVGGHWGMVMSVIFIALDICALISGFLYRLVALLDTFYYRLMMSWIGFAVFFVIHAFPSLLLGGMMHASYVPSEIIRNKTILRFPQMAPVLESQAIFGYDVEANPMLIYFFVVVLLFIFIVVPFIEVSCIVLILYKLAEMKSVMSKKTYQLHKNLLFALTVQILLPQVMILLPDVAIVLGAWKEWPHVNIITETTMMFCTFHSILDNFVMIFVIKPYRKALFSFVDKYFIKKLGIRMGTTTSQPSSQAFRAINGLPSNGTGQT